MVLSLQMLSDKVLEYELSRKIPRMLPLHVLLAKVLDHESSRRMPYNELLVQVLSATLFESELSRLIP